MVNLEIVKPHQFEPGDKCLIKPITDGEKQHYGPGWLSDKDKYIGQTVTVCCTRTSPLYGPLIVIDDGREFQTYHLEPIYPYDMI